MEVLHSMLLFFIHKWELCLVSLLVNWEGEEETTPNVISCNI